MIRPWTRISSKFLGDFRVFTVRSVVKRSPVSAKDHEFFIIDSVNWVNVIALTASGEIVLVEQYRQGTDTVELEVPGGMIDAVDGSPEAAAARELREETGCTGDQPKIIGKIFPNPAIMSNTCFTVLMQNCRVTSATQFDHTEDLVTRLVPVTELPSLVESGKIRHCIVIAALYHFELWRQKTGYKA